tara:strand:+ start:670 stop:2085 length:1416 start_codon:yes stop_codon:yes gene_type:complete
MARGFLRACALLLALSLQSHASDFRGLGGALLEDRPLTLEDAIGLALQANHHQLELVDQVEIAEIDYASARAAYKTKFMATSRSDVRSGAELGSYSGLYLKKRNVSGSALSAGLYNSDFGDRSLSELRFTYTLPFFRDKYTEGQLALTRADIEYVRRQNILRIGQQELARQVTSHYYDLIIAQDKERIALAQRDIAASIQKATRIRHRAGKLSEMDLSRAELRYLNAEQAAEVAAFQRELAADNLKLMLGMGVDTYLAIDPDPQVRFDETLMHMPTQVLEETALNNRIEIQGKRDELDMARKKLGNFSDNKLPQIDIDVHYSLVGEGEDADDSFSLDDQKWGIGFSMDTDFAGTERKSRRRKLYLLYQSHQRELEHITKRTRIAVRSAQFEAQRNLRQLELSAREHELARRQLEQAQILYDNDRLNRVELLESENQLHEVEHRHLVARVNYILANMELSLASGQYESLWGS